jgi:hypothetical protein
MALPDLHKFERLVKNNPAKGSNDYPVAIKAKDLDDNWKMTTLLEGTGNPKLYEVEYTKDGTRIIKINALPRGVSLGDILYWDPEDGDNGGEWRVLISPPRDERLWVLGFSGEFGLQWYRTEGCEEEE